MLHPTEKAPAGFPGAPPLSFPYLFTQRVSGVVRARKGQGTQVFPCCLHAWQKPAACAHSLLYLSHKESPEDHPVCWARVAMHFIFLATLRVLGIKWPSQPIENQHAFLFPATLLPGVELQPSSTCAPIDPLAGPPLWLFVLFHRLISPESLLFNIF